MKFAPNLSEAPEIIHQLSAGDTILLSEFSRLGRSMLEFMEIKGFTKKRGRKKLNPSTKS